MKLFFSILIIIFPVSLIIAQNPQTNFEQYTYTENFETGELQGWASYPLWQDTAYDPNFRVHTIVPGDTNLSIVQKVTPYTNVDNYAGSQKKLEMYLISGSKIQLRYYIKTHLPVEFLKIRLVAGENGKIDFTIKAPPANQWQWIKLSFKDFIDENPSLAGEERIKVNALAVLVKIPDADPAMPIFLGIDDFTFQGVRKVHFKFQQPEIFKLAEWEPYIPKQHYRHEEIFKLKGTWDVNATRISIQIHPFTDKAKTVLKDFIRKTGNEWQYDFKLNFPQGLYLAILTAYDKNEVLSTTQLTFYIAPQDLQNKHPRLWFDGKKQTWVANRLNSERFSAVKDEVQNKAEEVRTKYPISDIVFEMDQFPGVEPLIGNVPRTIYPWFDRITPWRDGVYYNSIAFSLLDDKKAGEYAKKLIIKVCQFPFWTHPWFKNRGQHIYYPVGEFGIEMALGYDLVFDLLSENERQLVRDALMKNIVIPCHRGYVEDNLVSSQTSNWVAHITGGSLTSMAAIYSDDPELDSMEPYFTGAIMKDYMLIQRSLDKDGAYGEGYGYFNFSMKSWSRSLPTVENVFNLDLSQKLHRSYSELIWAGNVSEKQAFYFGDSQGKLQPLTNFAWLLPKYNDPLLGWFYNQLKEGETLMDVLYETKNVHQKNPFDENPNKVFWQVGTTVFKSGWQLDDFIFVMRSGAFFNHQHLDQGTFWLADRGEIFIGERQGSTYYDDPFYQPWFIQPVAHSTILIDHNHQSQRVGDPLYFADGFDDYAFIYHYLDGTNAAFSSGDIGRLYWGKVKEIRRNVLYMKPRTLIMLDTIIPADNDVDVTLLYQTKNLKDIQAAPNKSTITKNGNVLNIFHLHPEKVEVKSVQTPHYIFAYRDEKPLLTEGMLTVTARTKAKPLVIANCLSTVEDTDFYFSDEKQEGYLMGELAKRTFCFSTELGKIYQANGFTTDALALTWDNSIVFAAICNSLEKDDRILIQSDQPITFEMKDDVLKYFLANRGEAKIGVKTKPVRVILNNQQIVKFNYDEKNSCVMFSLPKGNGKIIFEY